MISTLFALHNAMGICNLHFCEQKCKCEYRSLCGNFKPLGCCIKVLTTVDCYFSKNNKKLKAMIPKIGLATYKRIMLTIITMEEVMLKIMSPQSLMLSPPYGKKL